jgi:hypothetical protein
MRFPLICSTKQLFKFPDTGLSALREYSESLFCLIEPGIDLLGFLFNYDELRTAYLIKVEQR